MSDMDAIEKPFLKIYHADIHRGIPEGAGDEFRDQTLGYRYYPEADDEDNGYYPGDGESFHFGFTSVRVMEILSRVGSSKEVLTVALLIVRIIGAFRIL